MCVLCVGSSRTGTGAAAVLHCAAAADSTNACMPFASTSTCKVEQLSQCSVVPLGYRAYNAALKPCNNVI
jgi:hypothetical protein